MSRKNGKHTNPSALKARLETLHKGVTTVLAASKKLEISGQTFTAREIAERLLKLVAPIDAAEVAQVRASQAVHERDNETPSTVQFVDDLEQALKGSLGASNAALEHFGIPPKRPHARRSSAKNGDDKKSPEKPTERAA